MTEKLAIAIPTFNRAGALSANLPILLEEAQRLGVGIYISDDSSDGATRHLAETIGRDFPIFRYRHNHPALRHDANILSTLAMPDAEYVWLLGDILRPKTGELENVIEFLSGQDFVFINSNCDQDDTLMLRRTDGPDACQLLLSKLWHQTLTGATIYRRNVIDWASSSLSETHKNFPQLDVILGYAEAHPVSIGWFGRKIVHAEHRHKGASYWRTRGLDVFVDDWVSVVEAYPGAIPPAKLVEVLRSHSSKTGLFDLQYLHELSRIGHFKLSGVRRRHFWHVMHESPLRVLSALLPDPLFQTFSKLKRMARNGVQVRNPSM